MPQCRFEIADRRLCTLQRVAPLRTARSAGRATANVLRALEIQSHRASHASKRLRWQSTGSAQNEGAAPPALRAVGRMAARHTTENNTPGGTCQAPHSVSHHPARRSRATECRCLALHGKRAERRCSNQCPSRSVRTGPDTSGTIEYSIQHSLLRSYRLDTSRKTDSSPRRTAKSRLTRASSV